MANQAAPLRTTPRGTKPGAMRVSTKRKRAWYDDFLIAESVDRQIRRELRLNAKEQ